MEWYCINNGIQRGPLSREELLALVRDGALQPDDYVWTAAFGEQWRHLRDVPELQAEPPVPVTPVAAPEVVPVAVTLAAPEPETPLLGVPGKAPRFAEAMQQAWDHMKQVLFRHAGFARWMAMAFCVWISIVGVYEPNLAGDAINLMSEPDPALLARLRQPESAEQILSVYQDMVGQMLENAQRVLTPTVVAVILAAWLVFTVATGWFRARGAFMVMHCWLHPDAPVRQSWAAGRTLGRSLFLFRLGFGLVMSLLAAAIGYAFYLQVLAPVMQGTPPVEALKGQGILLLLAESMVLTVWFTVVLLVEHFAVPVMYWRRVGIGPALRVTMALCNERPWPVTLYFTMYLVLVHLAGALLLVAMCCTCCCAAYLLFLPFVNGVLLLPATIFFRGLGICYLRQWRPDLERNAKPA
jgi:hypothetical protein